jgi:hypothetical protein
MKDEDSIFERYSNKIINNSFYGTINVGSFKGGYKNGELNTLPKMGATKNLKWDISHNPSDNWVSEWMSEWVKLVDTHEKKPSYFVGADTARNTDHNSVVVTQTGGDYKVTVDLDFTSLYPNISHVMDYFPEPKQFTPIEIYKMKRTYICLWKYQKIT